MNAELQYKDDAAIEGIKRAMTHLDRGEEVVLRRMADHVREGYVRIFRSAGAALGKPWVPLKDSTQKARTRMARKFSLPISGSAPILRLFGDLKDATTKLGGPHHQAIRNAELHIYVEQTQINRHDRTTGQGMAWTKQGGTRRKPRAIKKKKGGSRSHYPDNIIELHDEGQGDLPKRPIVGTPRETEMQIDREAREFFDSIAEAMNGGPMGGA